MGKARMSSLHAKILVVGPQRAGKTAVSNNIAKFREIPSDYYHATVGVRVHEFEHVVPGKSAYSDNMSVSIELWDVSGDHRKYKEFGLPSRRTVTVCSLCSMLIKSWDPRAMWRSGSESS